MLGSISVLEEPAHDFYNKGFFWLVLANAPGVLLLDDLDEAVDGLDIVKILASEILLNEVHQYLFVVSVCAESYQIS